MVRVCMTLKFLLFAAQNPHLGFFGEFGKALGETLLITEILDSQMLMEDMVRMEGSGLLWWHLRM